MDASLLAVRRKRALRIHTALTKLYPTLQAALQYRTHFEFLIAVILSAQCTDKKVNEVTQVLFKRYESVGDLARARVQDVERIVHPTGFYRSKAKNIIRAAQKIEEDFGGEVPQTMAELITIPGAARKTANVVLGELFGKAEGVAVDTHVRRFAIRFDLSDSTNPKDIEKDLMEILPRKIWWSFTTRLIRYAREYCPAREHECAEHLLTRIYPQAAHVWPASR